MQEAFVRAMDDDFNTAAAVAALFESLPAVNRFMDERGLDEGAAAGDADRQALETFVGVLRGLGALLGIFETPPTAQKGLDETGTARLRDILSGLGEKVEASAEGEDLVERLIALRAAAREGKDFKTADDIRRKLHEAGIVLEDRAGGTTWTQAG